MKALQLCCSQFSRKETLEQTYFKRSAILHRKRPFCVWAPFGGLGTTYDVHLGLIGKRVVDFLLVLIELLSLGLTAGRYEKVSVQNGDFAPTGAGW